MALYSKEKPLKILTDLNDQELDDKCHLIAAEFENFYVVCINAPTSGETLEKLPKSLEWDSLFRAFSEPLVKQKCVIICGDLNVAYRPIDVAPSEITYPDIAGYTEEEKANMQSLLALGLIDTFKLLYPNAENCYTFWADKNKHIHNEGWRLDYCLISTALRNALIDVEHKTDVCRSNHCPLIATFDRGQIENQAKITAFTVRREQFNTGINQIEDYDLGGFFSENNTLNTLMLTTHFQVCL